MRSARLVSAALAIVAASAASAEVTFYDLFKNVQYTQDSAAQPTTPFSWDFGARIFSDTANEVTHATLDGPNESSALTPYGDPKSVGFFDYGFATEAALDAAHPTGNYAYTIDDGGVLDGQSGSFDLLSSPRVNEVPYLTNGSYDALTHATAGTSVSLSWNPYTVTNPNTRPVDFQLVFFGLTDTTLGTSVVNDSGANGTYFSQTIDGSLLIAGHTYAWSLFFDPRYEDTGSGFAGTGTADIGFDSVTSGSFTIVPVPEPASLAALGVGLLALRRRKR